MDKNQPRLWIERLLSRAAVLIEDFQQLLNPVDVRRRSLDEERIEPWVGDVAHEPAAAFGATSPVNRCLITPAASVCQVH